MTRLGFESVTPGSIEPGWTFLRLNWKVKTVTQNRFDLGMPSKRAQASPNITGLRMKFVLIKQLVQRNSMNFTLVTSDNGHLDGMVT